MAEESQHTSLLTVITDRMFPEIDCFLRQGGHIGQEEITRYNFLLDTHKLLGRFYRQYSCELVFENRQEGGYFYLSPYESLFRSRQLSPPEMVVGMVLAYMLMDPEYISKRIPLERLISTLKGLMGEDEYFARMAPRQRGKNIENDEIKATSEVTKSLNRLSRLGLLKWDRKQELVIPKSAIYRFIDPIRGLESKANIETLVKRGFVDLDELEDVEPEEQEFENQEMEEVGNE